MSSRSGLGWRGLRERGGDKVVIIQSLVGESIVS